MVPDRNQRNEKRCQTAVGVRGTLCIHAFRINPYSDRMVGRVGHWGAYNATRGNGTMVGRYISVFQRKASF